MTIGEKKYLKNNHAKIARLISQKSLDLKVLKSSKKNNTSFINTFNFGGLGKFWGGGYFPIKNNKSNHIDEKVIDFIERKFNVLLPYKNDNPKSKLSLFKNLTCMTGSFDE